MFCSASGSKAQDATNAAVPEQSSPDGFIDQADQHDLQAIQNHNLLIALGGVAARRASGAPHFSMPVSFASFYFIIRKMHLSKYHKNKIHSLLHPIPLLCFELKAHFFEPHFLRASQQFPDGAGEVQMVDDNSNNSSMSRRRDLHDDDEEDMRDDMDDDDDDENDADSTNLPLNLVATQFAE